MLYWVRRPSVGAPRSSHVAVAPRNPRCDLCVCLAARSAVALFFCRFATCCARVTPAADRHTQTPLPTSNRNETEPKRWRVLHTALLFCVAPVCRCVKGEMNAQECAPLTHRHTVAKGRQGRCAGKSVCSQKGLPLFPFSPKGEKRTSQENYSCSKTAASPPRNYTKQDILCSSATGIRLAATTQ